MASIDLLTFNVRGAFDGEKFEQALTWLPKEEHASITRFKFDIDKKLALASHLLRRYYFSKKLNVPWFELEFDRLPMGKPILRKPSLENFDSEIFDYNTSHEGTWVVFGCVKNMKIGVDAVIIDRPKNTTIDSFISSFQPQLTKDEMSFVMSSLTEEERLKMFMLIWGCKESYAKALGAGLTLEFNKIELRNENNQIKMNFEGHNMESWYYHASYLDDRTIAVVCCGYSDSTHKLGPEMLDFASKSLLLGEPLHNRYNSVYTLVKFEDIDNSRYMSRT